MNKKISKKYADKLLKKINTEQKVIIDNKNKCNINFILQDIKILVIFLFVLYYLFKYILIINLFVYFFYDKTNHNGLTYYILYLNEKICSIKYNICKNIYYYLPQYFKNKIIEFKLYMIKQLYKNIMLYVTQK